MPLKIKSSVLPSGQQHNTISNLFHPHGMKLFNHSLFKKKTQKYLNDTLFNHNLEKICKKYNFYIDFCTRT